MLTQRFSFPRISYVLPCKVSAPYIEDDQSSLDLKNKKAAIYGAEVKNSTYFSDKLIVNW